MEPREKWGTPGGPWWTHTLYTRSDMSPDLCSEALGQDWPEAVPCKLSAVSIPTRLCSVSPACF